jgi:hypothetical protein
MLSWYRINSELFRSGKTTPVVNIFIFKQIHMWIWIWIKIFPKSLNMNTKVLWYSYSYSSASPTRHQGTQGETEHDSSTWVSGICQLYGVEEKNWGVRASQIGQDMPKSRSVHITKRAEVPKHPKINFTSTRVDGNMCRRLWRSLLFKVVS